MEGEEVTCGGWVRGDVEKVGSGEVGRERRCEMGRVGRR